MLGKFRAVLTPVLLREDIFGLLPPPKPLGGRGTERCAFPKDGAWCAGAEEKPPRGSPVLPPIGGRGTLRAICVLPTVECSDMPPVGRATSWLAPIELFIGPRAVPFAAPTLPANGLFPALDAP